VDAVQDDLDDDVVAGECRADDAGIAMPERAHRIEEVGHCADAGVERRIRVARGRVGVAARDRDLVPEERLDERVGARELRRERHEPDRPRGEQAFEEIHIRVPAGSLGMDPESQGGEERPLEVHAEDAGPVGSRRHLAEGGEELLFGSGDEGREVRGDAGLEQRVTRTPVALGVRLEEVDPREAVDLEIHEPGDGDAVAVRRDQPVCGDTAVLVDLHVAGDEAAVDESGFDAEPHRSTARRML
jgi:hypothetical protein